MSDRLPPNGGPGPFDGWDLEGMLSGENVWLPDGMRPVAGTLASLRSAPMPAELSDEARARAAFREITLGGRTGSAPPEPADDARTLILPARAAADPGPHVVPRPRHAHRRPPRRGRWGTRALVGAASGAAAVVIVGGIALAGVFSGGNGHPGVLGSSSGATSAVPQATSPGSNGVEGTASKAPTPTPTPSHAGQQSSGGASASPGPTELCRQYLQSIGHQGARSDRAAARDDLQRLSDLAGGPWHVLGYCLQLQPWAMTPDRSASDPDGLGFPAGSQDAGSLGGPQGQGGAGGAQGQGGPGQQPGNAGNGNQQ